MESNADVRVPYGCPVGIFEAESQMRDAKRESNRSTRVPLLFTVFSGGESLKIAKDLRI